MLVRLTLSGFLRFESGGFSLAHNTTMHGTITPSLSLPCSVGSYLWPCRREINNAKGNAHSDNSRQDPGMGINQTSPQILYDLFGTVNHKGTLNQGHYVSNVKIGERWYHCNDAHVSETEESTVLSSDGAYILFYIRSTP